MNIYEQKGILFVYLCGIENKETSRIEVREVNSMKYVFQEFAEEILNVRSKINEIIDDEMVLELFCVVGSYDHVDRVNKIFCESITQFFERILLENFNQFDKLQEIDAIENEDTLKTFIFLYLKHLLKEDGIRYPVNFFNKHEEMKSFCFYSNNTHYENRSLFAETIYDIWFRNAKPRLIGKQTITEGFMLDDLNGRRIISHLSDNETGETYLLLEGGLKLYLRSEYPYYREKLGYANLEILSIGDIDTIIGNPIYAFNKLFQPYELYEDWQKVLNYVMAVSAIDWKISDIKKVHEKFMQFMEKEICQTEFVNTSQTMISQSDYYRVYEINIQRIRDYFSGKEEVGISKDYVQLLTTRYVFLPAIIALIQQTVPKLLLFENPRKFDVLEYNQLLEKLDCDNANDKGKSLENIAEYLVDCSSSIQVMGKRLRTSREEIDLSCCNISLKYEVWKLGALILIECKNWEKKVGVEVLREIAYIMSYKGNATTILFASNGITINAENEIINYAMSGKYILCINKNELKAIDSNNCFEELINRKYSLLVSQIGNSIELLSV